MNKDSLLDTVVKNLVLFCTGWKYPVEGETVLLWARAGRRRADLSGGVVLVERNDSFTALALFYGIGWSKSRQKMDRRSAGAYDGWRS